MAEEELEVKIDKKLTSAIAVASEFEGLRATTAIKCS